MIPTEKRLEKIQSVVSNLLSRSAAPGKSSPFRPREHQPLTKDALYERAKVLATEHQSSVSGQGSVRLYRRFAEHCVQLDAAYRSLSEAAVQKEFLTPGAEWLLDNYHIVQQQIQDIRKHFPRGYDKTLPKLLNSGQYEGYPRVYHIALELLLSSDSVASSEILHSFISGYQSVQELTMGELWAVPIMLRFALIENLSSLAERMLLMREERKAAEALINEILGDESQAGTQILLELASKLVERPEFLQTGAPYLLRRLRERGRKASLTVQWLEERLREDGLEPEEVLRNEQYILAADQISIGNSFTSLRAINYIDWKHWYESADLTHYALRKDPAQQYHKGDFKTRDLYRHIIELLAKRLTISEKQVAEHAVTLAQEAKARLQGDDPLVLKRESHVGYYLIGAGRTKLEERLGYIPPLHNRIGRWIKGRALGVYLAAGTLLTGSLLYYLLWLSVLEGALGGVIILLALLLTVPASEIVLGILQWAATRFLPPDQLPKLELKDGIPDEFKTTTVVQTILSEPMAADRMLDSLEVRYLGNSLPNISFGLLADLPDADSETTPADDAIIRQAQLRLEEIRQRHPSGSFYVLFRRRQFNPAQGRWMAWERKRGKIEEFNRLLLGDQNTSFHVTDDARRILEGVRYVITLDNDSQLPRGSAKQLIGAMAHPLNTPVVQITDPESGAGKVVEGYGIIQPRMSVSLTSAHSSLFAGICAGDAGLDPYTQTVSELYQDLFHEGSYIGKGIYDVRAFHHALADQTPENALLSHDLFEGNFVRCALASDIELFDDFPSRYHVHSRRLHRWVRGDWQLLPWLGGKTPRRGGRTAPTELSPLHQWKIFDNLRRSLLAPSLFALFLLAGTCLPGGMAVWVGMIIAVVAFPAYFGIAQAFVVPARGLSFAGHVLGVGKDFILNTKRALLSLTFLTHQASLMVHSIVITLFRVYISKKNLLEWETAFSSERRLGNTLSSYFREMRSGVLLALAALALIIAYKPGALAASLPLILLWISSPAVAFVLSNPRRRIQEPLTNSEREYLTAIAWKTWRYFREHLNPEHNFLIPDNVQLVPNRIVAPRTSPTNVSLSMLSLVTAHDQGFASIGVVTEKLLNIFQTLDRLERFRGHFLNWYSTRTLDPLLPRYISFVDSGNMVGHLIAAKASFKELQSSPVISAKHLTHGARLLTRAAELIDGLHAVGNQRDENTRILTEVRTLIQRLNGGSRSLAETVSLLSALRSVEDLLPTVHHHPSEDRGKLDELLVIDNELGDLTGALSVLQFETLDSKSEAVAELRAIPFPSLQDLIRGLKDSQESLQGVPGDAISGECRRLLDCLRKLESDAETIIQAVDLAFLYDQERELFAIGYDVGNARRDGSFYDLLASEARLGSLAAIALGQVPQQHWFALGRPLAETAGGKALMAWSGTMFEYLMPLLATRDYPGTILSETYRAVVQAQKAYGIRRGVPWGISESAYSGVDFEKTYQYHAFGVPGLGLKRGLEEDLVISPYSTFMALVVEPRECLENLRHLERLGMSGDYGFFEAADYTPSRLSGGEKMHIVQSFFAHHQGMSLVSLNNVLTDGIFQDRFHSDQRIRATELLLQERFPDRTPVIVPATAHLFPIEQAGEEGAAITSVSFSTPHTQVPMTHLLSNGRYAVMVDNAGSGFSVYERELALTRWREDSISDRWGSYIYLRDVESGDLWSTSYQPTCAEPESYEVFFGPDKIEFKRRDHDIFLHTEITVSPEDNVEIRRVSLTNLSSKRRVIELTSFGEVVLTQSRADNAHPAFAKMFTESEFLADYDALLFSRRSRSKNERSMFFMHMVTQRIVWDRVHFDTSRFTFVGRGRGVKNPAAFNGGFELAGKTGYVLDPIFSLRTKIELEPGHSESVTFVSAAAENREQALQLAGRYKELHAVSRAFEMAWSQSSVELRNEQTAARQWQTFQRLGNALIYNVEKLRGKAEATLRNRLPQSGLWRFGISGDFPLCLVRITEPDQVKLVQEALHAHNYLRLRGLVTEFVILNEYPGGYLQNLQEELEYTIRSHPSGALADRRGGVFLRTAQQLSDEEKDLLHSVSRVVLSGARGTLAQQVRFDEKVADSLIDHPRTLRSVAVPTSEGLEFFSGYGGFAGGGTNYELQVGSKTPPLPWSNIVANPDFGFLVTESGGGYTYAGNCRENRITPWSNDPISDPVGEVLYIRDVSSGHFWSATPAPVFSGAEYSVEHRPGASSFKSQHESVQSTLTLTVSESDPVKWFKVNLKNTGEVPRKVELYLYIDWVLGVSRDETSRHVITAFDSELNCLTARNQYNPDFGGAVSFVGSNLEIKSYTASKVEFVGRNRDLSAPIALASATKPHLSWGQAGTPVKLSRKVGAGFENCGVISISLELPPHQEQSAFLFLGQFPNNEKLKSGLKDLRDSQACEALSNQHPAAVGDLLSTIQVKTPDRGFDIMMNSWLLYQTTAARLFARTGFYQSGGAFGFRDQLQDSLALLAIKPELVRAQLLLHASRQFPEGDVQHWWHPPTGKGVRTKISDDYLFMPYVALRYLEATGDSSIFDEQVRYLNGPVLGEHEHEAYIVPSTSELSGSFFEHCMKALDYGLKFGPHGITLMGCGDWNDGMNEVGHHGKGESIWLSWFLLPLLRKFAPLMEGRGHHDRAAEYIRSADALRESVERDGWDGNWYRRAYYDDGTPMGSAESDECQIDSIAQSWSVISGEGDPERAKTALKSAYTHLVDKEFRLIKLLTPPFDKGKHHPGYIKGYLPGIRENGGQYTHAATWLVIAYAMLGEGDTAFELWKMINPLEHGRNKEEADLYMAEPYVLCGDVYAVAPHQGRAGWSWYSGSSSWLFQAGLENIVGLRVRADHFTVDPCIPKDWQWYSVNYRRGGTTYRVTVENPNGVSRGVSRVEIDGELSADRKVAYRPGSADVTVRVILG